MTIAYSWAFGNGLVHRAIITVKSCVRDLMTTKRKLPSGVTRFLDECTRHRIHPQLRTFTARTHTALEAAQILQCEPRQIVKSLLFMGQESGHALLALTSGANRVDLKRLAEILGEKVRLASPQEVRELTGYTVGAVPPLGKNQKWYTIIDEDLGGEETLWVSGGTSHSLASLTFESLVKLTSGKVTNLTTPQAKPVRIVPYNPDWPTRFQFEKERLINASAGLFEHIEHIGSTSVPGLSAKPIIDILAGIKSLSDAPVFIPLLQALGYQYVPEYESQLPERRYLTLTQNDCVVVHLHVVVTGSRFWCDHLTFRDRLLENPDLRDKYAKLKSELAQQYGKDRIGYTNAKSAFIRKVLRMRNS